jgi:hypothetical protein
MSDKKAKTWAEVFATPYDGDPDNVSFELDRTGGRATYTLDIEIEEGSPAAPDVEVKPISEKPLKYRLPPNCS